MLFHIEDMHTFAHSRGPEYLTVEVFNIQFWYCSVWIFFFFILTSYLLGYIGYTLAYEKEISDSGNSPIDEVKPMIREHWEVSVPRLLCSSPLTAQDALAFPPLTEHPGSDSQPCVFAFRRNFGTGCRTTTSL